MRVGDRVVDDVWGAGTVIRVLHPGYVQVTFDKGNTNVVWAHYLKTLLDALGAI